MSDANEERPYDIVIGLEVHVQLLTEGKLFCDSLNEFGGEPNSQTCPVCVGMPGTLPVMNRTAFDLGIKAAVALDCRIAEYTKWDRKSYYYPDLPKGYQVSQYDLPFAEGGAVDITTEAGARSVRLTRIHLEEDAGKNTHSATGGDSFVDLNRAGTPLLEIVSEPDMRSAEEAREYLNTIRTLMRDLDISDCEMQEGSLRCDANINLHIHEENQTFATPIVEIKNMNSVRGVERAIAYEAARQYDQWREDGLTIGQAPKQTRGWDDPAGVTKVQREKEEASDYRYFPEPDLVPVVVDDAWIARVKATIGETSAARKDRYRGLGLNDYAADVLVEKGRAVSDYFELLLDAGIAAKPAANWVINDLLAHAVGRIKAVADLPLPADRLAPLIRLVEKKKLNPNDAREKVLPEMISSGKGAKEIVKVRGLGVVVDTAAIEAAVAEVLADPKLEKAIADYRGGKQKAFGALVGQVMRRGKGQFPAATVNQILLARLGG